MSLEMVEQLVKLPKTVSEDRIQERTEEQVIDIPVLADVEELMEVSEVLHQDRSQQYFVEHTDATPDISFAEKIVEKLVTQLLQFIDEVVDIPVVAMRQTQSFQKTIELSQLQVADKVSDVPVVLVVQPVKTTPHKTIFAVWISTRNSVQVRK